MKIIYTDKSFYQKKKVCIIFKNKAMASQAKNGVIASEFVSGVAAFDTKFRAELLDLRDSKGRNSSYQGRSHVTGKRPVASGWMPTPAMSHTPATVSTSRFAEETMGCLTG